jgi:hypothetical protein
MATKVGENIQIAFDCTLLKKMAKNKLNSCLIMYDDIADELILKFLEPKHQTSYYYIDDNSALIIDDVENAVVGLSLLNFKEVHFADSTFNEVWSNDFEKSITRNYVTITNPDKEIASEKNQLHQVIGFQIMSERYKNFIMVFLRKSIKIIPQIISFA